MYYIWTSVQEYCIYMAQDCHLLFANANIPVTSPNDPREDKAETGCLRDPMYGCRGMHIYSKETVDRTTSNRQICPTAQDCHLLFANANIPVTSPNDPREDKAETGCL